MNELETPIGTKERPKLSAGSVIVKEVKIDTKDTRKGGKVKMVFLLIQHPDKDELISISSIKIKKIEGNKETILKDGLWYHLDDENNIEKDSNVAKLLKFYKKETLKDFINSSVTTEADANGYLAIKAY